jgi:hypothetical protein
MNYDHLFQPLTTAKNAFMMHSTPAPNTTHVVDIHEPANQGPYLAEMEMTILRALKAQIKDDVEHVLWNYFGMGAYLRAVAKKLRQAGLDEKQCKAVMWSLRCNIAIRFVSAFDSRLEKMDADRRENFRFHLTGPTGESFPADLELEPRENYCALVEAFKHSKYQENVLFCPETDAYMKGQELADLYDLPPGQLAPVSVINAASEHLLGNKWFLGYLDDGRFNAAFAIDENAHRRSSLMALGSFLINRGFKAKGVCSKNIQLILQIQR